MIAQTVQIITERTEQSWGDGLWQTLAVLCFVAIYIFVLYKWSKFKNK